MLVYFRNFGTVFAVINQRQTALLHILLPFTQYSYDNSRYERKAHSFSWTY